MIRPARTASLILIVPFLTFASVFAPAHVHEPGPGHDHDHAVAHSHFAPHHLEAHHHDADEQEVENDVEHVVWLDSPILHQAVYAVYPLPAAVPLSADTVQLQPRWSVIPSDDAAPVHGPPRPSSPFRGPPTSTV